MSTTVQSGSAAAAQVAIAKLGVNAEVISGVGAAKQLGPALAKRGVKSTVVVTGNNTSKIPLVTNVVESLKGASIGVTIAPPRKNRFPMITDLEDLAALYREVKPDFIVCIGGGAVMDLAKAAAIVAAEGSPAEQHAVKYIPPTTIIFPELPAPKIPVAAVPTLFPGSESNGSGHIRGGKESFARSFRDPKVTPQVVVLDPIAGEGQRPIDALGSALNAYAHCTDALCAKGRSPFSDALAAEGIRLMNAALPDFARDPAHPVARVEVQWASVLAGILIQHSFVGIHHGISHGLVDICATEHGHANGMMLAYTIAWHLRDLQGRDRARLADALPSNWFATLTEVKKISGLPLSLRDAGVPKDALPKLVDYTMKHRTVPNEILTVTPASVERIVNEAYEGVNVG